MRDLLVIVPTRGRPAGARDLMAAFAATGAAADLIFAVDDDDPYLLEYQQISGARIQCGPRRGLAAWTNEVAVTQAAGYRALASMGDDHRPRTPGWDAALLGALDETGGTGIAYGDDRLQGERVPTAPVVSADIVTALGWMCLPSLRHYYVDDVWAFLGRAAGCLHYLPEVVIEHLHPLATGEPPDSTYTGAAASYQADQAAFREWQRVDAAGDVSTVKGLLS